MGAANDVGWSTMGTLVRGPVHHNKDLPTETSQNKTHRVFPLSPFIVRGRALVLGVQNTTEVSDEVLAVVELVTELGVAESKSGAEF